MNLPALALALATVTPGPVGQDPRPASPAVAAFDAVSVDQQGEPRSRRQPGDRPHTVGIGGQIAVSNRGGGGGVRLFLGDRLGVNFSALYYRHGSRYTSNPQSGSTFAALPSFLLMLTRPDKTRDVDIRPYVGGGLNYVRSSTPVTTIGGTTTLQRRSGTGGQVFGGVEMTFREADWVTISAEGIYYKLPVNFVNASIVGGFNYLLAFHFYLK